MDVKVVWKEDMELTGYTEGDHTVTLDASEESGGHNKGPLPIALLDSRLCQPGRHFGNAQEKSEFHCV